MANQTKRGLMVLTSVAEFPASAGDQAGRPTGFYMDEMATPYWALRDAGMSIDIASIKGGKPPVDANSMGEPGKRKPAVQRFLDAQDAMEALENSLPISELSPGDYDLIFLPGGHGTMWDFRQSKTLAALVGKMFDNGAIIGAVCHGPAGLIEAKSANGVPIVNGKRVNSFTDAEEEAVELEEVVPYLVETELRKNGALFEGTENFQSHAVRDGNLITGQNPASVEAVAELLLEALSVSDKTEAA